MGLDYAVVPFVLEMTGIDKTDWPQTFDDLQVMERAALACMARKDEHD